MVTILDGKPFENITKEVVYNILKPCFDERVLDDLKIKSFRVDNDMIVVEEMTIYHKYFKQTWKLQSNITKYSANNFRIYEGSYADGTQIHVFNQRKMIEALINYGFLKVYGVVAD